MPGIINMGAPMGAGMHRGGRHPRVGLQKHNISISCLFHSYIWLFGKLPAHYSLRQKAALILAGSRAGNAWDVLQTLGSVVSCAFYVASTYDYAAPPGVDEGLTVLFTVDYLIRLFAAANRMNYPFGFFAIVDALTCLPVLLGWALQTQFSQLNFARFVRILRILRILRAFKLLNASMTPVTKQLISLVLSVLSMVFVYAGIFNLVESQQFEGLQGYPPPRLVSFGDAVYHAVVTLATVGYGDIYPITDVGKFLCGAFIITAIITVPMQVNMLAEVLSLQSRYRVSYSREPDTMHVLLVGNMSDEGMIKDFLRELFHEDRLERRTDKAVSRMCILMGPNEPSESLKRLIVTPNLSGRVMYVLGSAMSAEALTRVRAEQADAIFVISDVTVKNTHAADNTSTLRALKLKNFAPSSRIFLHTLHTEALAHVHSGHQVSEALCVEEWRTRMLAHSSIIPGFATLLSNLIRTMSRGSDLAPWMSEYTAGAAAEVYVLALPKLFDGMAFSDVFQAVLERFGGKLTVWGVRESPVIASSSAGTARLVQMAEQASQANLMSTAPLRMSRAVSRTAGAGTGEMTPQSARSDSTDNDDGDSTAAHSVHLAHKIGRRRSAMAKLLPGVTVPGRVLFNPGSLYRMKAGQVLYVVAQDEEATEAMLLPGAFAGSPYVKDKTRRLPAWADGGRNGDGYGFPLKFGEDHWTWSENASSAERSAKFEELFHDYNARKGAVAEPETSALPNGPLGRGISGAKATAKAVWDEVRLQVRKTAAANHSVKAVVSQSQVLRQRARRMSLANVSVTPGVELIAATTGTQPNSSSATNFARAAFAIRDRRLALQSVIVRDVRLLQPPPIMHIIVCGSLRAFKGFLAPLRDTHLRNTSLWRQIVLLTSYDESGVAAAAVDDIGRYKGVSLVMGNPSNSGDLLRAGIGSASCVVLLADTGSSAAHDARASAKAAVASGVLASPQTEGVGAASPRGGPGGVVSGAGKTDPVVKKNAKTAKESTSDPFSEAEALDSAVIFRYLVLEQILSTLHTRPSFYVMVELTMTANLQVLNSKRVGKICVQEQIASKRMDMSDRLPAMTPMIAPILPGPVTTPRSLRKGVGMSLGSKTVSFSVNAGVGEQRAEVQPMKRVPSRQMRPERKNDASNARFRRMLSSRHGENSPVIGAPSNAMNGSGSATAFEYTAKGGPGDRGEREEDKQPVGACARVYNFLYGLVVDLLNAWYALLGMSRVSKFADKSFRSDVNGMFATPFYAAGYGFPVDTLHAVLASAYFNPDIIPFAEELLAPCPGVASRLLAEPVPRRFHGETYGQLVKEMVRRYDAVVVGLYRCRGSANARMDYVLTAPPASTVMFSTDEEEDLMYVLSRRPLFVGAQAMAPEELRGMEEDWSWAGSSVHSPPAAPQPGSPALHPARLAHGPTPSVPSMSPNPLSTGGVGVPRRKSMLERALESEGFRTSALPPAQEGGAGADANANTSTVAGGKARARRRSVFSSPGTEQLVAAKAHAGLGKSPWPSPPQGPQVEGQVGCRSRHGEVEREAPSQPDDPTVVGMLAMVGSPVASTDKEPTEGAGGVGLGTELAEDDKAAAAAT